MKKTLLALCATMAMAPFPVLANLYKEGTELHGYVAQLDQYLPEQAEVYFINRIQPTALLDQLEPDKEVDAEIQGMMKKAVEFLSYPITKENRVFAKTFSTNKQANGKSLCAVYTVNNEVLKRSYMHEMMHCAFYSNRELYERNGIVQVFQPLFAKSFKDSLGRDVDTGKKVIQIAEVHAHVMAQVIWQNSGITADRYTKTLREKTAYPYSAAKTATARGIELCQERSCPVDPSELATVLVNDKAFVEALRHDLSVLNDYEAATARN